MPRRIIYIKNPTSGSHFRTLGGGGGSSRPPSTPTPRTKSQRSPEYFNNGVGGQNGYMPGYHTPNNWYLHTSGPTPAPSFGTGPNSIPEGIGPYITEDIDVFHPSTTIWGMLYDMASGIDPQTGALWAPPGSPGLLRDPLSLEGANMYMEAGGANGTSNAGFLHSNPNLPTQYWRQPIEKWNRPSWLK